MSASVPCPAAGQWRDAEGTRIALFSWVEQVADDPERAVLPPWLHQQGQVVGWDTDLVYVCFPGNQVISVRPGLLRVLDHGAPGGD